MTISDKVTDRDRKHVAEMELLRLVRPLLADLAERRASGRRNPKISRPLLSALRHWYSLQPASRHQN